MSRLTIAILSPVLALTVAACSAGGLPTPRPSAGASDPLSATGIADGTDAPTLAPTTTAPTTTAPTTTAPTTPEPAPTFTPRPTEIPGPPAASLAGGLEGPVPGELGAFFWGGLGSDSPWIVPSSTVTAKPGATLLLALSPALAPERWTTSWSPIWNGAAGRIAGGVDGAWNPIRFKAPVLGGPWGALVELHFPSGERAAFYWRVDVVP
jgi:hypothetical protein